MRATILFLSASVWVLASLLGTPVHAQYSGLKCYNMKDALHLKGTADLETPSFGVDPGCKISNAKRLCVPATTSLLGSVNDASTDLPIARLPLSRAPQAGDQICYKVKCPAPIVNPEAVVTDEFGTRAMKRSKAAWLCSPAVQGQAYCGDGTIGGGEQCEASDLGGATCESLGYAPGVLACAPGCTFDTSGCPSYPQPGSCGNGTVESSESCDGVDLGGATCANLGYPLGGTLGCRAWCAYDTSGCVHGFPATGQTACWNGTGGAVACAGTGQDGDFQAGATLSYTDNGDGTVTDDNTRLMWEKLADDGSIHDKDNVYAWVDAFAVKVTTLNTVPCFAGHCDWRVPNRRELLSLVNFAGIPAVAPEFNTGCAPGCTMLTCSCITTGSYWSSSTEAEHPTNAWFVNLYGGSTETGFGKGPFNSLGVRAVRAGS